MRKQPPERIPVTIHPDDRAVVGNVEITREPDRRRPRRLWRLSNATLENLGRPYDWSIRIHRCKMCGGFFLGHYTARLCSDACVVANRQAWLDAHRLPPLPRPPSKAARRRAALAAARCAVCGGSFVAKRLSARFCSDGCRQRAHRLRQHAEAA